MNLINAIILGIIQGLTEFIPISSTAHLTLAGKYLGLINPASPEQWTAFIATIQLGTLIAVLIYFKHDLVTIPKAFLKENIGSGKREFKSQSFESRMGWLIGLGSIPIFTFGLIFKKIIEGSLTKELNIIGFSLIILAIIFFIAERIAKLKKDMKSLTIVDSLIIGFAQCIALIPGSSRSGTTITAGLFLGLNRETAARFSFLLSIPAVAASGVYEFYKSIPHLNNSDIFSLIISTLVAGISGYYAISFFINFLKTRTNDIFIIYRLILGSILLYLFYKS